MCRLLAWFSLVGICAFLDVLYFNAPFFGVLFVPIAFASRLIGKKIIFSRRLIFSVGVAIFSTSIACGLYRDNIVLKSMQKNVSIFKEYRARHGFFPKKISDAEGMVGVQTGTNRFRILRKYIHYYQAAAQRGNQETAFFSYSIFGEQGNIVFDLTQSSPYIDMP